MKISPLTRNLLLIFGALILISLVILSTGDEVLDMDTIRSNGDADIVVTDTEKDTKAALPDLGFDLPAFQGITRWWNTPGNRALTPASLKGKVVMVKFWTYSCINCIRTYPFIKRWHELYADDGFVLIGVHTPEFQFESKPENVAREIEKNEFEFPVALDPDYKTWRAYNNRFWPASYLFDKQGNLRYTHFGEGAYDETEQAIQDLLMEEGGSFTMDDVEMPQAFTNFELIQTRETYFGYDRAENLVNTFEVQIDTEADYEIKDVRDNQWSIGGAWRIEDERAVALAPGATHRFNVQAPIYNLVLDAPEGTTAKIRIMIDGRDISDAEMTEGMMRDEEGHAIIEVSLPDLYRIVNFIDMERHTIDIEVIEGSVRFYAATFG